MKSAKLPIISIPNPCSQDWQHMTPAESGRHCEACDKLVTDFTAMSIRQIQDVLIQQAGHKTCGRFREEQLHHSGTNPQKKPARFPTFFSALKQISDYRPLRYLVFLLAGSTLTNCSSPVTGEAVMEDSSAVKKEQIVKDTVSTHKTDDSMKMNVEMGEFSAPLK